MNLGQMKNDPGSGSAQAIPSLKRTLSGGAAGSVGHGHPGGLTSHLSVGMNSMNSIPSVLHATCNTNPPQMLRAVTSSGVYNRPASSASLRGGSSGPSGGGSSGSSAANSNVTAMRSISQSSTMQDWRMYLTIEERQAVRSKIRDAYTSRCSTYEDLLQVVRFLTSTGYCRLCVCVGVGVSLCCAVSHWFVHLLLLLPVCLLHCRLVLLRRSCCTSRHRRAWTTLRAALSLKTA